MRMSCSFIQMKSEDVIKLAKAVIAEIEAHREKEWALCVDRERRIEEKSWMRRLFKNPVSSDEVLLKRVKSDWVSIAFIDGYATITEAKAWALIRAAKWSEVVNVSAEDLRAIGG